MEEIKVICNRGDLVAIADAVRNKTGSTKEMTLDDIASNIGKISGGGGVVLPTLTNEANASNLLIGTQLIDSDGNIVDGAMPSVEQAVPSITVDEGGLITASASQTGGYVEEETKSATKQLATQAATLITPTSEFQTAVASGVYTTGAVTVAPIPDEYIIPNGELEVTENGVYDITEKASVSVAITEKIPTLQEKTITPTKSQQEVIADDDFDGLLKVNVEAIPEQYITPDGMFDITENGTHDITEYAFVNVNIQGGSTEPDYRDLYQRVEYITSAEEGTYPYIITDFIADNTCGLEVIASFPAMQDRIPMGSRTDGSTATRFYCVYPLSTSSVYYGFNSGSNISCSTKVNTIYRLQTNFLNSRLVNVYEENGTRKASASLNATLAEQTVPVSIFGYNSGSSGAVSSKREYKLYSARCSRNHEVVRDYVPCYRKSDGEIGLYEKCTGQFLTNDGAGSFAKGADIEW